MVLLLMLHGCLLLAASVRARNRREAWKPPIALATLQKTAMRGLREAKLVKLEYGYYRMPIGSNVQLGKEVRILHPDLVNLYGCVIGDETRIGTFVEIQVGAKIGSRCKISSHTFICEGVTIEDEVFVGHGVMFINDRFPSATTEDGKPQGPADWKVEPTHVCRRAVDRIKRHHFVWGHHRRGRNGSVQVLS